MYGSPAAPVRFMDEFERYYPNFTLRSRPRSKPSSSSKSPSTSPVSSPSKPKAKSVSTTTTTATPLRTRTRAAAAAASSVTKATTRASKAVAAPAPAPKPAASRRSRAPKARAGGFGAFGGGNMSEDPEKGMFRLEAKLQRNSPEPIMEICFSFDTTGSMAGYLAEVKEKVEQITRQLLGDLPNIRISIIAHGDYCDYNNYVLKKLDLSNDLNAIPEFIKGITSTGGGDGDECYELVLQETQSLSWTPTTAKALVVIGDAAPHKPHEYRGIDWKIELEKLKAMGVKVYGVRCGTAEKFYEEIANETGGATLELKDMQGITEMVMGLCYREAASENARRREAMDAISAAASTSSSETGMDVDASSSSSSSSSKMMEGPAPSGDEKAEDVTFDQEAALKIHKAIHNNERTVKVNGKMYNIAVGYAGCKFVKIGDETYIEQNKDKSSKYAQMAIEGRKITWIIRKGKWGLIMDDKTSIEQTEANSEN